MKTIKVIKFTNVYTHYTEIGKPDERSGKANAITNIMLNPEKDSEVIKELFECYKEATGMTNEKEISDKFFKMVKNEKSPFNNYYKLKTRRALFYNKNLKRYTPSNIKGEFSQEDTNKAFKRCSKTNSVVLCRPNYSLFIQDATGEKIICHTDKRNMVDDLINLADVQLAVETGFGVNAIQLTLYKYKKNLKLFNDDVEKIEPIKEIKTDSDIVDDAFSNINLDQISFD